MNVHAFKIAPTKAQEAEAIAVKAATDLLEEHAACRQSATLAANLTNLNEKQTTRIEAPLTPEDEVRLAQLMTLAQGPHGAAVLKVMRVYMPDLFGSEPTPN